MRILNLRVALLSLVSACCLPNMLQAQVTAIISDTQVVIKNKYLSRSFTIRNHHLLPGDWVNLRTGGSGTVFKPGTASEEFCLHPYTAPVFPKALPRTGWKATANSEIKDGTSGAPQFLLDGDPKTIWHSNYGGGVGVQKFPFILQLDLGQVTSFCSFGYLPRQVGNNGNLKGFEFYAGNSKESLMTPENLVCKGELAIDGSNEAWFNLPKLVKARYVCLVQTSSQNGYAFASGAEFYLSKERYQEDTNLLKASAPVLKNVNVETVGNTKRLTFDMEPYRINHVDWDIDMVVELNEQAHYLYKYLKISVPDNQRNLARIDYIDLEHLNTQDAAFTWTHPSMGSGVGGMSGYLISLGQPVYINGMFLGSEFPETDNSINDNLAHVRYYSGKSLAELAAENRLEEGRFITWKNVLGAARSVDDLDVIRSDFFAYLDKIARPTGLRIQYNSWYDWMMDITDKNIITSFKEMERGLTQNGVRPLDSYVIDDGWNAYGPYEKENTTGFWQFNSKFPNGLGVPADFSHSVSSNFGLWLGPRGGYNYNYDFAKFLESQGNGTCNRNNADIVTGDKVYLEKLLQFFLQQQRDYKINYWKLDGFCAVVPQPSTNGRYITGGTNGIYYMTEHAERWAKVLDAMYEDASQRNSDLWINLTCYVNPSPWLLQWCNSVWMQISADMGRKEVDGRSQDVDLLLNYRDDRYFDFVKTREFQFPLSHIFNHDPTYGKTGCVEPNAMNDDEFRAYLYMMATRGTAFWEMLYSYNLLDEGQKWQVNAEALNFLQQNYNVLRHAKLIGQTPVEGNVYGFSCWDEKEGIVSLRNPKNEKQTFTLKLDRTNGVPERASGLNRSLIMAYGNATEFKDAATYRYGDELNVTLNAGEILICRFSPDKDLQPANLLMAAANGDPQTVDVEFDEPLTSPQAADFVLSINGKKGVAADNAVLHADLRTVTLHFATPMKAEKIYTLTYGNVKDFNGNVASGKYETLRFSQSALVASLSEGTSKHGVEGRTPFSVQATVQTSLSNGVIAEQPQAFSVNVAGGSLLFKVGSIAVLSKAKVNDGAPHRVVCCREKNGMLKIYIDGNLDSSMYDKGVLNESLTDGKIVLSKTFKGQTLKVYNRALTYKEIAESASF